MTPAVTVKGQVTIPKPIRDFLHIGPGSLIRFEPLPDGRVAIASVHAHTDNPTDPVDALIGCAPRPITTDEVMRLTRGDDWNQP